MRRHLSDNDEVKDHLEHSLNIHQDAVASYLAHKKMIANKADKSDAERLKSQKEIQQFMGNVTGTSPARKGKSLKVGAHMDKVAAKVGKDFNIHSPVTVLSPDEIKALPKKTPAEEELVRKRANAHTTRDKQWKNSEQGQRNTAKHDTGEAIKDIDNGDIEGGHAKLKAAAAAYSDAESGRKWRISEHNSTPAMRNEKATGIDDHLYSLSVAAGHIDQSLHIPKEKREEIIEGLREKAESLRENQHQLLGNLGTRKGEELNDWESGDHHGKVLSSKDQDARRMSGLRGVASFSPKGLPTKSGKSVSGIEKLINLAHERDVKEKQTAFRNLMEPISSAKNILETFKSKSADIPKDVTNPAAKAFLKEKHDKVIAKLEQNLEDSKKKVESSPHYQRMTSPKSYADAKEKYDDAQKTANSYRENGWKIPDELFGQLERAKNSMHEAKAHNAFLDQLPEQMRSIEAGGVKRAKDQDSFVLRDRDANKKIKEGKEKRILEQADARKLNATPVADRVAQSKRDTGLNFDEEQKAGAQRLKDALAARGRKF